MRAHLAAIGCNGQEISRAHLAAIGCNGLNWVAGASTNLFIIEIGFHHIASPEALSKLLQHSYTVQSTPNIKTLHPVTESMSNLDVNTKCMCNCACPSVKVASFQGSPRARTKNRRKGESLGEFIT